MVTKERLAAMAASLRAVCSGSMIIKVVKADPTDDASELRTYVCAECGHTRTYGLPRGKRLMGVLGFLPMVAKQTYGIHARKTHDQSGGRGCSALKWTPMSHFHH
jgi:hypothetical protein